MKQNKYPSGWNERKVRKVLRHYESQTDDEAITEDEGAFELKDQPAMVVRKPAHHQKHREGNHG